MNIEHKISTVSTLCAVVFLAVFFLAVIGQMDYEDATKAQKHYCEMVKEGMWPDYKKADCSQFETEGEK